MAIENTLVDLGRNVYFARRAKGLSQMGLAYLVGMTQSSIANIEAGRQNASMRTIYRIAEVLEVGAAELLAPVSIPSQKSQISVNQTVEEAIDAFVREREKLASQIKLIQEIITKYDAEVYSRLSKELGEID